MQNKWFAISFITLAFTLLGAAAPTAGELRFAPTKLGSVRYELFEFGRFGIVPVGPALSRAQRQALMQLTQAQDKFSVLAYTGVETAGQDFSVHLPPLQSSSYKAFAPQFLSKIVSCIRSMPEDSGELLIMALAGMEKLEATRVPKLTADFDAALAGQCSQPQNTLNTEPYTTRALAGVEMLLSGDYSLWLGTDNYIELMQGLGDRLFAQDTGIFAAVAHDYLKTVLRGSIAALGEPKGIKELTRPEGFTTFVDFLVVAKTKSSLPSSVLESITENCLSAVSDIFKTFTLQTCGTKSLSMLPLAIGETKGTLVTFGDE